MDRSTTTSDTDVRLPRRLWEPVDFFELHDAAYRATRYCTVVFHAAIGAYGTNPPDEELAAKMSCACIRLYTLFDLYLAKRRGEMNREIDLAGDDVEMDRVASWVACFIAANTALVAAACVRPWVSPLDSSAPVCDVGGPGGVPFTQLTALSFRSVARQRLPQTDKLLIDYGPRDLVRALESVAHSWGRIVIDDDVLAFVLALRVRLGILMLTVAERRSRQRPEIDDGDKNDCGDPLVDVACGGKYVVPSASFALEMAARFQPYSEMRLIAERYRVVRVCDSEACARIAPQGVSTRALTETLYMYAQDTVKYGTISTAFRRRLQEVYVGPGDPGAMEARDPGADTSPKNAIYQLRGSRFYASLSFRSRVQPAGILERVVKRGDGRGPTGDYVSRSTADVDEEFAGLCAMHALVRSRYGVDWVTRFLVTRATFREERRRRDAGRQGTLPVLIMAYNTYDVLYEGTVVRTSSLFESLAWWLAIIARDHRSSVAVTNAGGEIRVHSPRELPENVPHAARGTNLEAIPIASSLVVDMSELCGVALPGGTARSFVVKMGDLEGCTCTAMQHGNPDAPGDLLVL